MHCIEILFKIKIKRIYETTKMMNVLAYPPTNEGNYIKQCTKECGIITTTQDCAYFALSCLFCNAKFIYFDEFIAHLQTTHAINQNQNSNLPKIVSVEGNVNCVDFKKDTVKIKQEIIENDDKIQNLEEDDAKLLLPAVEIETTENDMDFVDEDSDPYDEMVETSLLQVPNSKYVDDAQAHIHIKDRKMIKFLIDCYRHNTFLWDHKNKQFRDRNKRNAFLDWIMSEFKRKFNLILARDAVTRKWDNLRTVYKRELTRMSQENTSISTLWYFKELQFLNKIYANECQPSPEPVPNSTDSMHKRRYGSMWNDVSTHRLLQMVKEYPCFYDKYNADYQSKEKRGEALQRMVQCLQVYLDVNTIQISKRLSQLRFDYSKQKHERILCEMRRQCFAPNYSYYEAMKFMDDDIAPFKCEQCPTILESVRERELHDKQHKQKEAFVCKICGESFVDKDKFVLHKQTHHASKRQNTVSELLLPSLSNGHGFSVDATPTNYACDECYMTFPNQKALNQHRKANHERRLKFKCDFLNCSKEFTSRQNLLDHCRLHYSDEFFQCDICGKSFRSLKNMHNHKQIHDVVKRYICKICGSAFAQAAGLYLHKRRHNRSNTHKS